MAAPREREALLAWSAESTQQLLSALREAGPDRGCWTWWGTSQSPQTSGGVARHQVQEIAVHTYDAQLTVGAPQPLPVEVALDGVEEFLFTCYATTERLAARARRRRLPRHRGPLLAPHGRRRRRTDHPYPRAGADAGHDGRCLRQGTAGELVLVLYGRIPVDSLKLDGDRRLFDQLIAWEPEQ